MTWSFTNFFVENTKIVNIDSAVVIMLHFNNEDGRGSQHTNWIIHTDVHTIQSI